MNLIEWLWFAALAVPLIIITLGLRWSLLREDVWSISIYSGATPLSLQPSAVVARHPLLTASDVSDTAATFVADPFLILVGARWYMFFEVLESSTNRGVLAVASSADAVAWNYERVVLREPFHLSYPYVFEWQGQCYMIPETAEAKAVRLYRAAQFPHQWQFVGELLHGQYWDPSLIHRDGLWWLFAVDASASLTLHYSEQLEGPWTLHPCSPVVRSSPHIARPAGRLVEYGGGVLRLTQDGVPTYGSSVRAFQIDELSVERYRERELLSAPLLCGSGRGWNKTGMHHADLHHLQDGTWLASVDGNRQRLIFRWRAGARRMLDTLCDALPDRVRSKRN